MIEEFCGSTLVLHHFGVDMKEYIKFMPMIAGEIADLKLQFFKAMLRVVLTSFSKNPNLKFVEVVIRLLERFPKELMEDLFEFIIANNLKHALLAIGNKMLDSPSLRKYLSKEQFMMFFEEAKKAFDDVKNISYLEFSVGIIVALRRNRELEIYDIDSFIDSIWKDDYPSHILKVVLPLAKSFDIIVPKQNDSLSLICSKIRSMRFLEKQYFQRILDVLTPLITKGGDVFCEIVDFLAFRLSDLIINNIDVNKIVCMILNFENTNWIEKLEIIKFIDMNDQFLVSKVIPNYIDLCVHHLINGAIAINNDLSQYSRSVSSRFIGENNIGKFVDALFKFDFYNLEFTLKILKLLNCLLDAVIDITLFKDFIPILQELIQLYDISSSFQSELFLFFSHFPSDNSYDSSMISKCLDLLQKYYWSFTQTNLFDTSCENINEFGPIFIKNSTDIASENCLHLKQLLNPLKNCFKFLKSINHPKIVQISIAMLNIFPLLSLNTLISNNQTEINEAMILSIISLFNQSNDLEVLKLCLDFLVKKSSQSLSSMKEPIKYYLKTKTIRRAPVAYSFFRALYIVDNLLAIALFNSLSNLESNKEKNDFAVLLYLNRNNFSHDFIEHLCCQFVFLELNRNDNIKREKAIKWFKDNKFKDWPLICDEFNGLIIDNIKEYNIEINDFNDMDTNHWIFFLNNQHLFNQEQLENNILISKSIIKNRLFVSKLQQYKWENKVNCELKPPSLAPFLFKGIITHCSVPLLKSFFRFSKLSISKELYHEIISQIHDEELIELSQKYSKRIFKDDNKCCFDYNELINYKAKQLKDLCIQLSNIESINISEINEFLSILNFESIIKKPKRLFFYLRILSIFVQKCQNIKETLSKYIFDGLKLFQSQPEYILKELKTLCFNFTFQFPPTSKKTFSIFNFLNENYDIKRIKSKLYDMPSFYMMTFKYATKYPNLIDDIDLSNPSLLTYTSSPLCGKELINLFVLYPSKLNSNTDILNIILDVSSPLFSESISFLINIFGILDKSTLERYQPFFKKVLLTGYCIENIIRMVSIYFHALYTFSTTENKRNDAFFNECYLIRRIFEKCPTFDNTIYYSLCFLTSTTFFDHVFSDFFEKLKSPSTYFPSFYIIISQIHKSGTPKMKESLYSKYTTFDSFPFLSRKKSLQLLIDDSDFSLGLLFSFLETDDLSLSAV